MHTDHEPLLHRWVEADLIDAATAKRILVFEATHHGTRRSRWPVVVALAAGGLMLVAGVLLFVAAHWATLSPSARFALVLSAVAVFHICAALVAPRFDGLATTLHAAGTAAMGAGIFLSGQIFNLSSHWPSGVLLWALGALVGWAVLRDWPQAVFVALLAPVWLAGEWIEALDSRYAEQVLAAGVLSLAITYLVAETPERRGAVRAALRWIGGLAVIPATVALAIVSVEPSRGSPPSSATGAVGWACALGIPLALAAVLRGRAVWMNLAFAVWVLFGVLLGPHSGVLPYLWSIVGAAGFVAAGVIEGRTERINLGMAGFAIAVLWFYFSSAMDRLGRSASLMVGGLLFLLGGWLLERARRRLVARVTGAAA
jgi:uncharacterized membrane protein